MLRYVRVRAEIFGPDMPFKSYEQDVRARHRNVQ